jgi:hypothetical protein
MNMELTPHLREVLEHIPLNGRTPPIDEASIHALVRLGLLEENLDGFRLTQKGAIAKVMMRSLRLSH